MFIYKRVYIHVYVCVWDRFGIIVWKSIAGPS